jgi:hypothetical protein
LAITSEYFNNEIDAPDQNEQESRMMLERMDFIIYFFYPLQGFLNFLVYTRPRYLEYRKNEPQQGKIYAFRMSMTLQPVNVYQAHC